MDQCCSTGKSENFSFPLNKFPGQNQVHLLYIKENMQIVVNNSLLDNSTTNSAVSMSYITGCGYSVE
jgi:hypothetical protein